MDMKRLALLAFVSAMSALPFLLPGCVITNEGPQKEIAIEAIFPPSKAVSSYRRVKAPRKANDDLLAEQFGGKDKAAVLTKWNSFSSRVCEYGLPKQPPLVRVTVSEFGTSMNAFGAFSNVRPAMLPAKQYVKVGVQGVVDGERLFFVHDHYLVSVRHLQPGSEMRRRALLLNFGRGVSKRIPRPMVEPVPIAFLPLQHRVPATERLDKEDPVGLGVVNNGASAVYRIGQQEARMFMAKADGVIRKLAFLQKYRKAMEKEGPVRELQIGDGSYQGKLNKLNAIIAQREGVVFGILGTLEERDMIAIMAIADRQIKPYVPVKYKDVRKKKDEEEKEKSGLQFGG
jgi:hypothetical protein